MNFSANDLKELAQFADSETMKEVQLPQPREGNEFPIVTRLITNVFSSFKQQGLLLLPELRTHSETIAVFSDYGGEAPDSLYNTYSFLVCGYNQLSFFLNLMRKLREVNFPANQRDKEYAFKDRGFGPIERSLKDYLRTLDAVPGLLFTLVVSKKVHGLLTVTDSTDAPGATAILDQAGFGVWKPPIARKVLLICHVIAYLVALLSRDQQKILWMSHGDAITAGAKHQQAINILGSILPHYTTNTFARIGGAAPFPKPETDFRDLLSAADLAAGAFEHYFTRLARSNPEELTVDHRSDWIMQWLAYHGLLLNKHAIMITPGDHGLVHGGYITLNLVQPLSNTLTIALKR